jgi:putative flippase GtrA
MILKKKILGLILVLYPFFPKIVSLKTFKYMFCGGINALLNLLIFFIGKNYLFFNPYIHIYSFPINGYIISYLVALSFSFPFGFFLNKFIVFEESNLNGITQLFRYGAVSIFSIILNYLLLHLLVGYLGFWATPSQTFIIIIISVLNYLAQSNFSFKFNKLL